MKHLRALAFLAIAVSCPALIADDVLVKHLERTQAKLLKAVEGLSEEQWNWKPAPDRWSVAETFEHITAAEPFIRAMVVKALETPAKEGSNKDEMLLKAITDRTQKFKAPEPLMPTKRFANQAEALATYEQERAETIGLAKTDVDWRGKGADHFALGPLDAHGWLLFLSGHSERHTLQIEEVKGMEGFPK